MERLFDFQTGYGWDPIDDKAVKAFHHWRSEGKLGFFDLPADRKLHEMSKRLARELSSVADTLLVAGIGGSSLGLRALLSVHGGSNRVTVLDSPDAAAIANAAEKASSRRPAICVITKSGGTAETLSIFMELRKLLGKSVPVTAITDPEKGELRKLAAETGWKTLPVPWNVGGRFSVLSPVGVFPAEFAGMSTEKVLRGAALVSEDFLANGAESLAGRIAGAFLSRFQSHPIHVFMPYSDTLYDTALWFAQLWAESLGKARSLTGEHVETGQTPLACRGPADQHSLVQLFMEGPADKTITILSENWEAGDNKPFEGEFSHVPTMSYLEGRSPDELRAAEAEATALALEERGLPVSRIVFPRVNSEYLGQLFMAMETATVLCGLAMGIDPLDQPGVERGKVLTYRAMGREGY